MKLSIFWVRAACEICLASYGSKHTLYSLSVCHLNTLTRICVTKQVIYGHCKYRMTPLLSEASLCGLELCSWSDWRVTAPKCIAIVLWGNIVCIYILQAYIYIHCYLVRNYSWQQNSHSLWQYYTLNNDFTANDASFYKNNSYVMTYELLNSIASPHTLWCLSSYSIEATQYRYTTVTLILIWSTTVLLDNPSQYAHSGTLQWVCCQAENKAETTGKKLSVKSAVKVQKQGTNENTSWPCWLCWRKTRKLL